MRLFHCNLKILHAQFYCCTCITLYLPTALLLLIIFRQEQIVIQSNLLQIDFFSINSKVTFSKSKEFPNFCLCYKES